MDEENFVSIIQIPISIIMDKIITEAQKDLVITEEEEIIINDIKKNIEKYKEGYDRTIKNLRNQYISKTILGELVNEQNEIFLKLLDDTKNRIEEDGIISPDEVALFKSLANELDLVIKSREKQVEEWKS